jgi:hypothetical protein
MMTELSHLLHASENKIIDITASYIHIDDTAEEIVTQEKTGKSCQRNG